jgi:metal-responsive CopG/Arc/MetJ family transcriptional regulator
MGRAFDGRFEVIKRFIRDYTNKKEKKIKTTQDVVAAIQHMAATSKSKVQSTQIILNYEKMVPSKMVYVSSGVDSQWRHSSQWRQLIQI